MSLNASNFVVKGPIRSLDLKQFVDLFTGVMTDQPVTFKNAVVIGGNQGASTAPLKLIGVTGQAGNLIELYPTTGAPTPTFGFGALGNFAWGPSTPGANDTFLSRVATQNGHVTDTAGLLIEPYLEVKGNVRADGWTFTNGATITSPTANPFTLVVNQTLTMNNVNQRIRAMPAANVGIAMDSLDGYAEIAGTNAFVAANVYQDGAHWNRINNAVGVGTLAVGPGSMNYYAAPAATGQDPPWVTAFTVDSVGNASALGNISAATLTARQRNLLLPDGNCYIVSDTNNNIFIRGAATYIQTNTGAAASLSAGNITAASATFSGDITVNNVVHHGNAFVYGASNNGVVYFESSNAVYIAWRPDLGALYIPYGNGIYLGGIILSNSETAHGYVYWEASKQVYMHFDNANVTMNMAGAWGFRAPTLGYATTLFVGSDGAAQINRSSPPNVGDSIVLTGKTTYVDGLVIGSAANPTVTWYSPNDPQGGGQIFRVISASTRSAAAVGGGEFHMAIRLFVDGDITSGTNMHAVSFMTTSDPELKSNAVIMPDIDCMTKVRSGMPVYTYNMTPELTDGFPSPTPNDIGFMADDVYAAIPEFAALDHTGRPVSVVYGQMAALLWGALRDLDARCVAKGI